MGCNYDYFDMGAYPLEKPHALFDPSDLQTKDLVGDMVHYTLTPKGLLKVVLEDGHRFCDYDIAALERHTGWVDVYDYIYTNIWLKPIDPSNLCEESEVTYLINFRLRLEFFRGKLMSIIDVSTIEKNIWNEKIKYMSKVGESMCLKTFLTDASFKDRI